MAIHISASLLEDYLSCNRKVYYRTIRSETQVQNKEMVIGEVVHSAIEKYWDDQIDAHMFSTRELAIRLPNDADAALFADNSIKSYFECFRQFLTPDDKIELKFKIPFGKDVFIVGKMDRISNGSIFDWKTARTPPKSISSSVQFVLYNWAYKKLYNSEPSGVYYAALASGALIRYKHQLMVEAVLLDEIIPQAIAAMKNKEYIRNGIFRKSCYRCPYQYACLKELNDVMDSAELTKE
jgi:CRISPR/Cas system-associated exonuclease Cas4 (RecB family)